MATTPIPTTLDTAQATTTHKRFSPRQFSVNNVIVMTFLFVVTVYFLVPFYWLIVASTKTSSELFSASGLSGLWFSGNLISNLQQLFTYNDSIYLRWLLNTIIYAVGSTVVGTALSAMAGYALAKYVFPGRDLIFSIVLGATLVPPTILVLPQYLLMSTWGLTNTYWSVLLPSIAFPFGVYLSRIYASASVPDELLEAARIDGAGEFRTFATIAVRIMTPALVTVFLFQFVAVWNNYFLPLVMLSDQSLYPITLGLQTWNTTTGGGQQFLYSLIITGALISVIPLIIGCMFLQRYWRGGLGAGGVKG